MGSASGQDVARAVRRRALLRISGLALTATLGWLVLVVLAIRLGTSARAGSVAWPLVVGAGAGAAACLFVALMLASRVLSILRGAEPVRPSAGGHRAPRR